MDVCVVTSVTTARVPSEPIRSRVRSNPAEDLRELGYQDVWVMPDGIQGWHAAGYLLQSGDE